MHSFHKFALIKYYADTLCTGDSVEEQQTLLRRCFAELEAFSKFLAAMAALKYGAHACIVANLHSLVTTQ